MSRRRRGGGARMTTIWWRDIPAQVNVAVGDVKAQRILDARFQVAIDRAAMVADRTNTDDYVAEWRQTAAVPDLDTHGTAENAAIAEAERLMTEFTSDHVAKLVDNGGWSADRELDDNGDLLEPAG